MRILALALAIAVTTSGCAAMMKDAPESTWTPAEAPRCSESNGGVALDVIFSLLHGAVAIALIGEDEPAAALPFAGFGALHVWSAVSGHRATRRCQEANEAHERWLVDREEHLDDRRRRDREPDDGAEASADVGQPEPPLPGAEAPPDNSGLADPYADDTTFVDDDGRWKDFWREVKR